MAAITPINFAPSDYQFHHLITGYSHQIDHPYGVNWFYDQLCQPRNQTDIRSNKNIGVKWESSWWILRRMKVIIVSVLPSLIIPLPNRPQLVLYTMFCLSLAKWLLPPLTYMSAEFPPSWYLIHQQTDLPTLNRWVPRRRNGQPLEVKKVLLVPHSVRIKKIVEATL